MQTSLVTAEETATRFVEARRCGTALPVFPGEMPTTLEAAYHIQDAAISLVNDPVAGWKVGRIWPPLSEQFGADRLSGPIFSAMVQPLEDAATGLIFAGGFGAAEAEFLLCVGSDLPRGKQNYTLAEAEAAIARVHVGIEIASSPFPGINDHGPTATIADFGNNNGLIVGAEIIDWRASGFADWTVAVAIDGVEAGRGTASAFPDGPIGSVRFLLNNLGARGIAVSAGTWISTGAVTGVHKVTPGQRVDAYYGETLTTGCTIEAAPVI